MLCKLTFAFSQLDLIDSLRCKIYFIFFLAAVYDKHGK